MSIEEATVSGMGEISPIVEVCVRQRWVARFQCVTIVSKTLAHTEKKGDRYMRGRNCPCRSYWLCTPAIAGWNESGGGLLSAPQIARARPSNLPRCSHIKPW
jgi:hypothetical protein